MNNVKRNKGSLFLLLVALFALHGALFLMIEIPSYKKKESPTLYVSSLEAPLNQEAFRVRAKQAFELPLKIAESIDPLPVDLELFLDACSEPSHSAFWWHTLPRETPAFVSKQEEEGRVFWRGEIASYPVPTSLKAKHSGVSASVLRYLVQVDLEHGRLLCLKPLEEPKDQELVTCVRRWLWQQRFSCTPGQGILYGEVELFFGGQYLDREALCR